MTCKSVFILCVQGMDMVTRKTGTHIESDPEWESAFTLQLRMMPVLSMVNDWCVSDVSSCQQVRSYAKGFILLIAMLVHII